MEGDTAVPSLGAPGQPSYKLLPPLRPGLHGRLLLGLRQGTVPVGRGGMPRSAWGGSRRGPRVLAGLRVPSPRAAAA